MKNLVSDFREGKSLKDNTESKASFQERWFGSRKYPDHDTDGISPYKRTERICEAFIGKQFNKAFSEYCKQVPAYQQKYFLQTFEPQRWHNEYWDFYFVDKQGNIQKHKGTRRKKKGVFYYSDDYKTELRHKVTGEPKPPYSFMMNKLKTKEADYVTTVVSGYALKFSSGKDPEYMRLIADQKKRRAKEARIREKEAEKKAYSFISKTEKEIEKDKAKDRVKIEAKGFDYETSFRKDGINPDSIKEHQTLRPKK